MDSHHELHSLRSRLKEVLDSIASFTHVTERPPIIDRSAEDGHQNANSVRGLRMLRDSVQRDLDVLEKFLADLNNATAPSLSTNAPYLISVWNEVLHAPRPVAAIWSIFSENGTALRPRRRGLPKEVGVKVDIVADGGRRWIRVNTTKNARLLAEFREIDSYLTDSDEGEDNSENPSHLFARPELDNAILRMGRSLLAAAKENPLPHTSDIPTVTLRLTRLDPTPANDKDYDSRIPETIAKLRSMGIDVQLGERAFSESIGPPARAMRPLEPSESINLDLSILIALVSDLTHSPLPVSAEEAEARFTPGAQYINWKKKRVHTSKHGSQTPSSVSDLQDVEDYASRPARALIQQALQETNHALLEDVFERTQQHADIQFWTTPEARERCLQIVGKIGGSKEKARAELLLTPQADLDTAKIEFWRHSRYPTGYIPLLPIRLLPLDIPKCDTDVSLSPFFTALERTCRALLAQDTIPHPRSIDVEPSETLRDEEDLGEIQRATVMKANPRLTVHTVQSMLWGAVKGWTTLTANRSSVKILLREMKTVGNTALWETKSVEETGLEQLSLDTTPLVNGGSKGREVAAVWTVDPRSLAEGMRADIEATSS